MLSAHVGLKFFHQAPNNDANVFFFLNVFICFCQITTNVLTVRVRMVERVSTHLAATDVNVTMDTAGKTVI